MLTSTFHEFYTVRVLKAISTSERLVPVYASSNSKIYPFQIAAAIYAKVPRRVLLTYECAPTAGEQRLYDLLYAYVSQPKRLAFPEMDPYDLALRLLGLLGSSTAAILQTIRGIIRRLEGQQNAQTELDQWREMEAAALDVEQDAKSAALPRILELGFSAQKKRGAAKKLSSLPRAWKPSGCCSGCWKVNTKHWHIAAAWTTPRSRASKRTAKCCCPPTMVPEASTWRRQPLSSTTTCPTTH